jgi:hypothetical protein
LEDNENKIEQLRKSWRSLHVEAPAGAKDPGRSNVRLPHTLKQRIVLRLRVMIAVLVVAMLYYVAFMQEFNPPLWLSIYYEAFMALSLVIQVVQIEVMSDIRLSEATTVQTIATVKRILKLRLKAKVLLISLGIPLVVLLIWVLGNDLDPDIFHNMILGAVVGAFIGGIIGWMIDRRFRSDFRGMIEMLESPDSEDFDSDSSSE